MLENKVEIKAEVEPDVTYSAKACVLKKEDGNWVESTVKIFNRQSFLDVFKTRDTLEQVNLDKYRKVYYCSSNIKDEILSKVTDMGGETHYMGSPLILVECDDVKPIDITDKVKEEIKERLELY